MRYVEYARRFGWTPDEVDQIPLVTEPWLLPIDDAINKADHDRQEAARAAANQRGGRHRQR